MNWTWAFITIAVALAVITAFLHRAVGDDARKERIGAALCMLFGVVFLAMYSQDNQDVVSLILGMVCFVMGTQSLQLTGLRSRITKVEQRLDASGNGS